MRFLSAFSACILTLTILSCGGRGPAYRNINTSREVKEANNNSADQTTAEAGKSEPGALPPAAQTDQPAAPASQPFKPPKFMANGQAKDLPNYPQAITKSIQFGPVQGTDTLSLVLETRDSMDKIAAFYDKAIKSNGWTVDSRVVDSEFAEWNLKKTFDNEGKIQVKKDPRTNAMNIVIARTEKISQ
jgi:hypothetical protein